MNHNILIHRTNIIQTWESWTFPMIVKGWLAWNLIVNQIKIEIQAKLNPPKKNSTSAQTL